MQRTPYWQRTFRSLREKFFFLSSKPRVSDAEKFLRRESHGYFSILNVILTWCLPRRIVDYSRVRQMISVYQLLFTRENRRF